MSTVSDDSGIESVVDRLSYLFVLSRPRFWFYLAGPVVVGVAVAADSVGELGTPLTVVLFAYFLLPANVLLYGINDMFDVEVDAENPKKTDKETRWQGDRAVAMAVVGCGLVGVGLTAALPSLAWPWLGGFLFFAVGYSTPPLRFKTTPFLDSVSNGLYILPGIAAYAMVAGTQPPIFAVVGGWLWTMGMHTFSAIPDIEPDRAAAIKTTATVLGERLTYGYVAACWVVAAVAFGLVDRRLGVLIGIYPVFVAWVATSSVQVDKAYWWFPALNTAVGTIITLGALWEIVPVWEVIP